MVAVSLKKFFFKQKTAYEIRSCDWSSDVCSSDLTTIVMVTHEHELVAQFDHRIIQIEKGRLVADTGKIGGHNGRK